MCERIDERLQFTCHYVQRDREAIARSETKRRGEAIAGPRAIGDGETRGDGTERRVTEGGGFWKKFTITTS